MDNNEEDIESVMNKINKIDNKIRFISFGKTKPKVKQVHKNKKNNLTQEEKYVKLKDIENDKVERQIDIIKAKNQGRAGNVFRIRKSIAGPKNVGQEASSIKYPDTGELLVNMDEIKRATVKYCADNLTGNKPDKTVEAIVKQIKIDKIKIMEEDREETLEVEHEDFLEVV